MQGDARQLVREGRVTATFPERHTVRVEFEDKDNMTSAEMPILTTCAFDNKFYSMPDVGDMVVCLFASNADQTGTGWIIGSRFNDKSKPNANSQDVMRMDFKDGTFVEYDRAKHELKVKCEGKVFVEAKKEISVKGEDKITIEAGKEIIVKGEDKITVEAEKEIIVNSTDKITVNAEKEITVNSEDNINLNSGKDIMLNAGGEVVFGGSKNFAITAAENVVIQGQQILLN